MILVINTAIARNYGYVVDNPKLKTLGISSLSRELRGDGIDLFQDETSVIYAAERKLFRADPGRRRLVSITCVSSVAVNPDIADRCSIIAFPLVPTSKDAIPAFQFFPAVANSDGFFRLEGRISGNIRKGFVVGKSIVALSVDDYENADAVVDSIEQYARSMNDHIQELYKLIERCRLIKVEHDETNKERE